MHFNHNTLQITTEEVMQMVGLLGFAANGLRPFLDFANQILSRDVRLEGGNNGDNSPNEGGQCEDDENGLPCASGHAEGFVEIAGAKSRDEGSKKGAGSNPVTSDVDASQVLIEAKFKPVLSDDDHRLITIVMKRGWEKSLRRKGLTELRFRWIDGLIHCSLLRHSN